jgi:hypothetical protein
MAKQNLCILKALVIVRHGEMNLVRQLLNLLQQAGCLVAIAVGILVDAILRHLVNKFRVEKTLFPRLSLKDFGLEGINAVLVDDFVVITGRASGEHADCEKNEYRQRNLGLHEGPPQLLVNPLGRDYKSFDKNVQEETLPFSFAQIA